MVKSNSHSNNKNNHNNNNSRNHNNHNRAKSNNHSKTLTEYDKLASIGKISVNIISELYNPVDAINRFLNLALQNIEEGSQSRQFILESKSGIRKMSHLLNKLNKYAKKMEKEMRKISNE